MSEENSKTLAVIEMGAGGALMPRNFEGLYRMSQIMSASGMMPKGMERIEAVFVAIQMGLEVGLSPMQAVQNIASINGRPSIWGDAMLGLVRGSGLLLSITETITGTGDAMEAVCTVTRKQDIGETVGRFSVADAKRANLWGKAGPWSQYPRRMLQMRARGFALRDKFPDVLKGLYAREELEGEQYMGQAEEVPAAARLDAMKDKARQVEPKQDEPEILPNLRQPLQTDHETAHEAQDSHDWPKQYQGRDYDCRGIVHIPGAHSAGKTCNNDGSWRRAKGVSPESVAAAEKRYPRIDPLTAFGSGPAIDSGPPPILSSTDGVPGFANVLGWIADAESMDDLDLAVDASKDVELTDEQRAEVQSAAAAQAGVIEANERG